MQFKEAIESVFKNYTNFSGRACRSEYWYYSLFLFLVSLGLNILSGIGEIAGENSLVIMVGLISLVWTLATLIPSLSVSVRRLHDLNKSGFWLFIILIPLLGAIYLLILCCFKGTDGENQYGSDPLA